MDKSYKLLRKIACIDDRDTYDGNLNRRAISLIRTMEINLGIIMHFYFPALFKENSNDNFIREIIFKINESCGLDWIQDILVSLDRPYGILLIVKEIPIIYAPIQQFNTLSGLSIFHHELGHNVLAKFQEISANLLRIVNVHFNELKQSGGII